MRIQQIDRSELESPASFLRQPWLAAAYDQLLELPDHPLGRILIVVEGGRTHAILGLELKSAFDDRQHCAIIRVLEVDPEQRRRGIGSRLVRFAEGIAHVNGCDRVQVAPGLEPWGDGRCWLSLGYDHPGRGLSKDIALRVRRSCA